MSHDVRPSCFCRGRPPQHRKSIPHRRWLFMLPPPRLPPQPQAPHFGCSAEVGTPFSQPRRPHLDLLGQQLVRQVLSVA